MLNGLSIQGRYGVWNMKRAEALMEDVSDSLELTGSATRLGQKQANGSLQPGLRIEVEERLASGKVLPSWCG